MSPGWLHVRDVYVAVLPCAAVLPVCALTCEITAGTASTATRGVGFSPRREGRGLGGRWGNTAGAARRDGMSGALSSRASLTYYRPLLSEAGCEVRLHDTTLYTSIFRYDDNLLVNPHVWGQPASANPLLHLKRVDATGWFDNYAQSFEAVWANARPWTPDQEGTSSRGQD